MSELKKCESCGESFGCGAKLEGCWCTQMELSTGSAADLRASFNDCLCPKCLGTRSDGPAIIVRFPDGEIEIINGGTRVDMQNFHEGMFDFYDESGTLLRQIDMGLDISWEEIGSGSA